MKTNNYLIDFGIFLRGENLDPELVSSMLSLTPSSSQKKGEKRISSSNNEYFTQIGVWEIAATSKSDLLSDHIEELTSKVGMYGTALLDIEGVEEAYADVFIGVEAEEEGEGTCGFELSGENLRALTQLGLPVRFTVSITKE